MYTDDPIADFYSHDAEMQRSLEKCPICSECGEYVQDDTYYDINGEVVCIECLNDNYKRYTEDYIE